MLRIVLLPLLVAISLAVSAQAADEVKHSGRIVSIQADGPSITLEEIGPWDGRQAWATEVSIVVTPATEIKGVTRSSTRDPGGWRGGFMESPMVISDLRPGDFVTVSVRKHGQSVAADSIEVLRPSTGGTPAPQG